MKKTIDWVVKATNVIPDKTNAPLLVIVAILGCGFWSIHLVANQDADSFSRFGSFIVAIAILNFSFLRESFSQAATLWDRKWIDENIKQLHEMDALMKKVIDLHIDAQKNQTAQAAQDLNNPRADAVDDLRVDESSRNNIQNRTDMGSIEDGFKKLAEKKRELETDYNTYKKGINDWSKFLWPAELFLLFWGTLQWGYGDLFVHWFHGLPQK